MREFVALAVEVGRVIQELDPAQAAARDARLLREGHAFHFPSPTLGPGLHRARPEAPSVGKVAPQAELPDGRLTDDVAGPAWSGLFDGSDAQAPDAPGQARLQALGLVPIDVQGSAAATWLREQGAVAAILRPDRYVYDLCRDRAEWAAALDALEPVLAPGATAA